MYVYMYVRRGGVVICTCVIYTLATHSNDRTAGHETACSNRWRLLMLAKIRREKRRVTTRPYFPMDYRRRLPTHRLFLTPSPEFSLPPVILLARDSRKRSGKTLEFARAPATSNRTPLVLTPSHEKKSSTDNDGGPHYTSQYGDSSLVAYAYCDLRMLRHVVWRMTRTRKRETQGRRNRLWYRMIVLKLRQIRKKLF